MRRQIEASGRDPGSVTVVAATKGQSADACRAALQAGIRVLGENRIQEALAKMEQVPAPSWHFIGHLQRNKVARAALRFDVIQSVDSLELAQAIARRGPQRCLVEVNVAGEATKSGLSLERARLEVPKIAAEVQVEGLMTVAPREGDARIHFRRLKELRDELEQRLGWALPELSMGMSSDYPQALLEGATMIRLGRALFEAGEQAARNLTKPLTSRTG